MSYSEYLKTSSRKLIRAMGIDIVRYGPGEYARIRRKASARLAEIERRKGKTPEGLLKQAKDYARDTFGDKRFAPWLEVYAAMAGEFRAGWIPNDYYQLTVLPRINGAYGELAKRKALYEFLFSPESSLDLVTYVNGHFFSPRGERLTFGAAHREMFASRDRIIWKPDQSNRGRGIRIFESRGFSPESVAGLGSGVFQAYVRQHAELATYCASAVATLRLTTVVDDEGTPRLRACHVRLGRETEEWIVSARQVNVPVSLTTGEFADVGYLPDWSPTTSHPDTGVPFAGFVVPSFSRALERVVDLHGRFRFVQAVGWDLAIDEAGNPQVLEWNGDQPGIAFAQATQGPCFSGLDWENLWRAHR